MGDFQKKIVEATLAAGPKDAIFVQASAGSGKSTTLLECAKALAERGDKGRIICFNKDASEQMTAKLRAAGIDGPFRACTFHALGRTLLETKLGRQLTVDNTLADQTMKQMIADKARFRQKTVKTTLSIMRSAGTATMSAAEVYDEMVRRGNAQDATLAQIEKDMPHSRAALGRLALVDHAVDFDGMVHRPATEMLADLVGGPGKSWVLVDEAQDLNRTDLQLVANMFRAGNRLVFAGDRYQSINGFRGAMADAFAESKAKIARVGGTPVEMDLPVSFRLPRKLSEMAREANPLIRSLPGAPEGSVRSAGWLQMVDDLRPGDRVLCRTNAPLLSLAARLLRNGLEVSIREAVYRNVSNAVMWGEPDETIAGVLHRMREAEQKTAETLKRTRAANERDRLTVILKNEIAKQSEIRSFCVGCVTKQDVRSLISRIKAVSSVTDGANEHDSDALRTVRLSTVHSSKGMEADRVFLIVSHPHMSPENEFKPVANAMDFEELCCWYVAVTRVRKELVFVGFPDVRSTASCLGAPPLPLEESDDESSLGGDPAERRSKFGRLPPGAVPPPVSSGDSPMAPCLVCSDHAGDALCQPCNHALLCGPCLSVMPTAACPVCVRPIEGVVRGTDPSQSWVLVTESSRAQRTRHAQQRPSKRAKQE